jgi:cytochrome c oxidase subunit 2
MFEDSSNDCGRSRRRFSLSFAPHYFLNCALLLLNTACALQASPARTPLSNIFSPASTPANSIYHLALFVLAITGVIFVVVSGLLTYVVAKFRGRPGDDGREPVQIYGSTQIELAWTVIPVLIVVVLFLTAARVIHGVEDARRPPGAIDVTVVGHRFWWEFRYPQYGVVTANELHVPVSCPEKRAPTFLTLLSADVDHDFWVPRLAGKTDVIPNRINHMWIEPQKTGLYLGQCAMYCGAQHAHMLLRVYVESQQDFKRWIHEQQKFAVENPQVAAGRQVFLSTACINCHTIRGTVADGRFGPDLTHLMSRDTLASGTVPNSQQSLRYWIQNPSAVKPGCLMPAMNLSSQELDEVAAYLETLR